MALPDFTMRQLLDAGVHFGHQKHRWNPKMQPYLFGVRNNVHIIDLTRTVPLLHRALGAARDITRSGGRILFVGTKSAVSRPLCEAAQACAQYYIDYRWLGGTLTNWRTISNSIKRLNHLDEVLAEESASGLSKKERLKLTRERDKLHRALGGIKDMGDLPDMLFVIDTNKEIIAVREAQQLGIPVMAVLDSNSNPDNIAYPIPGNDDGARAILLYCSLVSQAALDGLSENPELDPASLGDGEDMMAAQAEGQEETGESTADAAATGESDAAAGQARTRKTGGKDANGVFASSVMELRRKTGAGVVQCRDALRNSGGDVALAEERLRSESRERAGAKMGREAGEGGIALALADGRGALVELNSETDFAARTSEFLTLARDIAALTLKEGDNLPFLLATEYPGAGCSVAEQLQEISGGTIRENLRLRRIGLLDVPGAVVFGYVHNKIDADIGRLAALVALESSAEPQSLETMGKHLAMHVAANAPANVEEMSGQDFVMDSNRSVAEAIAMATAEIGADVRLVGFLRFALAEPTDGDDGGL